MLVSQATCVQHTQAVHTTKQALKGLKGPRVCVYKCYGTNMVETEAIQIHINSNIVI